MDKSNLYDEGGKWRKVGFSTEAPKWGNQRVGYLGLDNMHGFMKKNDDDYQKVSKMILQLLSFFLNKNLISNSHVILLDNLRTT
jgi:hypothetical protein